MGAHSGKENLVLGWVGLAGEKEVKFYPAILLAPLFKTVIGDGAGLSVPHVGQALGVDPQALEIIVAGFGASFG